MSAVQLVRAEGKRWNLYFRTAWKPHANSAFVAQISPKLVCLRKELKRCYKTYIFLNEGRPGLSAPVSDCISWNCAPALWDPQVREGDQGSRASPAQHSELLQRVPILSCASSTFWDLTNVMSCKERRSLAVTRCSSTGSDLMGGRGRGRGVCRSPAWCEC